MTGSKIVSWDGETQINDGVNYSSWLLDPFSLPAVKVAQARRSRRWPLTSSHVRQGQKLQLFIFLERDPSFWEADRVELSQWFNTDDETPKELMIENNDGTIDRYKTCTVEAFQANVKTKGRVYVATLVVSGDYAWRRSGALTFSTWNITASGQTRAVNNDGELDVYPVFTLTPTSGKTGGFLYQRFAAIRYRSINPATEIPVHLTQGGGVLDTAALITAGKMQADGDDLRVFVNGVEVDRWVYDINTTSTDVWVMLNFKAGIALTLKTAIASSGAVAAIDVNEDISELDDTGILEIDSELFTYTGKNNGLKRITGVERAAYSTSMAAHSVSTAVEWIQNEILIMYGNSTIGAPDPVDTSKEPAFDMATSNNGVWIYSGQFGKNAGMPWSWRFVPITPVSNDDQVGAVRYTDDHATLADPWDEIGIYCKVLSRAGNVGWGRWQVYAPSRMISITFNGEKMFTKEPFIFGGWYANIVESFNGLDWSPDPTGSIAAPTTNSVWQAITGLGGGLSNVYYAGVELKISAYTPGFRPNSEGWLEFHNVSVAFTNGTFPDRNLYPEVGNYELEAVLENQTTGESVEIRFQMELNEALEIDTDQKIVTYKLNETNQLQAVTLPAAEEVRIDWLRMAPGSNTFQFTDAGTNGLTLLLEWRRRYLQ